MPSLPGYGYSDKPTEHRVERARIAAAWDALMRELGYDRYGAQGGDWGAMVTTSIGQHCAEHVTGIHVNMPVVNFGECDMTDLTEQESSALAPSRRARGVGHGLLREQSTRPQTLGYGLTDSPAGQCAWILEKFWAWTDNDGHPEQALTKDQMLDDISLYWFTATGRVVGAPLLGELQVGRHATGHVPVRHLVVPEGDPRRLGALGRPRFTDLRWYGAPSVAVTSPRSSSPRSSSTRYAASSAPCAEVLRPGQRTRRVPSTSCRALREISWL